MFINLRIFWNLQKHIMTSVEPNKHCNNIDQALIEVSEWVNSGINFSGGNLVHRETSPYWNSVNTANAATWKIRWETRNFRTINVLLESIMKPLSEQKIEMQQHWNQSTVEKKHILFYLWT